MAARMKGRMKSRERSGGGARVGMSGGGMRGGGGKGGMGGGMGRGGGGMGGGMGRGGARGGFNPMEMLEDLDAQKVKKIKEHLSKDQKKVLKQINDARKREFMGAVRDKMKQARQ